MVLTKSAYSQCNIRPHKRGEMINAESEVIYEKKDYPNYQSVLANLRIYSTSKDTLYGLAIITTDYGGSGLVPREISIQFTDDYYSVITLKAYSMAPTDTQTPGVIGNCCLFYLSLIRDSSFHQF